MNEHSVVSVQHCVSATVDHWHHRFKEEDCKWCSQWQSTHFSKVFFTVEISYSFTVQA